MNRIDSMGRRAWGLAPALILLALAATAGPAWAQFPFTLGAEFRDPSTAVRFSLTPPGARSLAMGGAFLGLADDATAAYTNPAGLTNLTVGGSEVAVEVRQASFGGLFADRGHYNTEPQFDTDPSFIGQDFEDGIVLGEAEGETSGVSFLSFGWVLPRGLVIALYRHELGNFESHFDAQGPFNDDFCFDPDFDPEGCDKFRVLPLQSRIDLEVVNYGVSAAFGFDLPLGGLETELSLGLGLAFYRAELLRSNEVFDLCRFGEFEEDEFERFLCADEEATARLPGYFYGPADFSPDNSLYLTREVADDDALGFNVGFLWKLGRDRRWSVGGVYRQGPEFDTRQETVVRADRFFPEEVFDPVPGRLTVPDVFGAGAAYRSAGGKTKVTLDANRVRYSQTLTDFVANLGEFSGDFALRDVTQVHVGLERLVLVVESLFVGSARLGAWLDPYHEPTYVGDDGDLRALLGNRPGEDELHLSGGLGLVIKEDYQIDLAIDVSEPATTVSFSIVKFF